MSNLKLSTPSSPSSDFAPALDAEPVFERPAVERWDSLEKGSGFRDSNPAASGAWADDTSAFEWTAGAGPAFIDPGSHALQNHVVPMMTSDTLYTGVLRATSAELNEPLHGGGGDGGNNGKPKSTNLW